MKRKDKLVKQSHSFTGLRKEGDDKIAGHRLCIWGWRNEIGGRLEKMCSCYLGRRKLLIFSLGATFALEVFIKRSHILYGNAMILILSGLLFNRKLESSKIIMSFPDQLQGLQMHNLG